MSSLGFREIYKANEEQTVFTTPQPYVVGSGTLYVYLNGLTCGLGKQLDYVEVDERHIEFNYPLHAEDLVTLATSTITANYGVDIVGSRNALFNMYGQDLRLMHNQFYQVQFKVKGKKINWAFSSRFSPLHNTEKNIRLITGDLLAGVTAEQINLVLYSNSKEVEILLAALNTEKGTSTQLGHVHKEWVKFKTAMDLVNAIYLSMTGQKGTLSKSIGKLSIEKTVSAPAISNMLKYFKDQFDEIDGDLRSPVVSSNFRRANKTEYPISKRRSF